VSELMKIENNLLISQTAGAGVFGGLIQNSTAFAAPSGLALAVDFANNYDVLVAAITQLRNGFRDANFILVDNDSYAKMVLAKSASDGHYLFGAPNISIPNVGGVPIYPMAVTTLADKFIVGDRNYATVAVRAGISVRFYDQHANNAIYNLVTVVVEERLALVVKRTDAFIYGDFSDAAAALETA
jgi:HK97 family phage major capsid protein